MHTAALIITYCPDGGLAERVARISAQVAAVYVVDDGSGVDYQASLDAAEKLGARVFRQAVNQGQASALNTGFELIASSGYAWCLTLDQDTLVDADMVAVLQSVARVACLSRAVGLVGSNARSLHSGKLYMLPPRGSGEWFAVSCAMTSGSLHNIAAWQVAGPFVREFRIGSIDTEFCLRLRERGYSVILTTKPLMTHAAGAGIERRLLNRTVLVADQKPARLYYDIRNFLWILRRYGVRQPGWALRTLYAYGKLAVVITLFERHRLVKAASALKGALAGITKANPIPEPERRIS